MPELWRYDAGEDGGLIVGVRCLRRGYSIQKRFEGGFRVVNPLAELRSDRLHLVKVENVQVPYQSEYTLADLHGPGCVVSLWMALGGGPAPALDGRIRVYYDGSSSAALDMDVGTLFATHWGAGSHAGSLSTPHMHVEINSETFYTGLLMTFPMPFGDRIRIAYYCPSTNQKPWLYSMVTYTLTDTDEAGGVRLRGQGARWADQAVTRQAKDTTMLANVTGGPGWLVWHSQVAGVDAAKITPNSGNADSWMERNFSIKVDGETTPSIVCSGTEDWFDSAWYFNGWKDYVTSVHSYVGTDKPAAQPNAVGMATELWSKWGGVRFTSSVLMRAETEDVCVTGDKLCWCVLYYQ